MNVDIQQSDEPLEGAAEVVDEMDPSQAAITAPDARLVRIFCTFFILYSSRAQRLFIGSYFIIAL